MTATKRPSKPTITMELMFVTPEMAGAWLEKNGPNRGLSDGRVSTMADDIRSGAFLPSHQGVAFDTAGNLCDGQHRLSAIVMAGQGIWLFVASNVPVETMPVLDSGRARTLCDRVMITEEWPHPMTITSAARCIAEHEAGRYNVSDSVVMATAKRESENLLHITGKRFVGLTTYGPVVAAFAYARPCMTPELFDSMFTAFCTGEMLRSGSPILTLRNSLLNTKAGKKAHAARSMDFRRALDAIRCHVNGEERLILRDNENGTRWADAVRKARGLSST
jgi:hypothetical protein